MRSEKEIKKRIEETDAAYLETVQRKTDGRCHWSPDFYAGFAQALRWVVNTHHGYLQGDDTKFTLPARLVKTIDITPTKRDGDIPATDI
jgi:hypothetical protein